MAQIKNGILGHFTGKVGPVVGYTRNGVGIIRSLPRKITKAPSSAQLKNRQRMALAQQWLTHIKHFVRVSFKHYSVKQHGFGNALSYLKLNALNEDQSVNPSRVLVSWGDLPVPLEPAVSNPDLGFLEFTWQPISDHRDDHALLLAYCVKTGQQSSDLSGAKRREGKQRLDCTNLKGLEVDIYIGFISQERDKCSNSVYLGKIIIG